MTQGLIELRTKGITSRPIKEIEPGTKGLIKWFNFLLPIIIDNYLRINKDSD